MVSDRQQQWQSAADVEAQRGNDLLAGFFGLMAQPNDEERAAARRRKRPAIEHELLERTVLGCANVFTRHAAARLGRCDTDGCGAYSILECADCVPARATCAAHAVHVCEVDAAEAAADDAAWAREVEEWSGVPAHLS